MNSHFLQDRIEFFQLHSIWCVLFIFCTAAIIEYSNVANELAMGLFVSGTNDALRVVAGFMEGDGQGEMLHLYHKMPSWGVSAKTFSLRAHKANSINYQEMSGGYASQKLSAAASETLFIVEEIAT